MANLRYQQHWLQQTEKGAEKRKTKKQKNKNGASDLARRLAVTPVMLLIFFHLSRASEAGLLSRAFRAKLSELTLLSKWVSFLRGLRAVLLRWVPPVLSTGGDKRSDGFF
jgi:hypothetical protein